MASQQAERLAPSHEGHRVLFWESESFLDRKVAEFARQGLAAGCGFVALTRKAQLDALRAALGATLAQAEAAGRATLIDSDAVLPTVLMDGRPDKARFVATLGSALQRVKPAGGRVAFFGDLVTQLCERGLHDAAVQVESWCEEVYAAEAGHLSALCAYPLRVMALPQLDGAFRAVCAVHSGDPVVEGYPEGAPGPERYAYLVRQQQVLRDLEEEVARRRLAEDRLRMQQASLELLVAERTRMLLQANQDLEAFGYTVSHDLQGQLRAIQGFSQILMRRHDGTLPEDLRPLLEGLGRAAKDMAALMAGLQQLAGLNSAPLRSEAVDIAPMVREALQELADREPGRRVETLVDERIVVHGDPVLLRLLIDNLVANAWKYTRGRPDARIEARAVQAADGAGASIVDNGVGFAPDEAARLFQPFQRLHGSAFEGRGIGLATVRRIVQRHGGQVWASGRPGEGATFTFVLPAVTGAGPNTAPTFLPVQRAARHIVRFLDDDASLAACVGGFLGEGVRQGEPVLAIATAEHHAILEPYKRAALRAGGTWISLDAHQGLAAFMVGERPDRHRFRAFLDSVASTFPAGRPFRAFGEMVNVLATTGNWHGAIALERLWNEYADDHDFLLLCTYSATHLLDAPRDSVRHACLEHQTVEASILRARGVVDLLGSDAEPTDVMADTREAERHGAASAVVTRIRVRRPAARPERGRLP